jgi:hypothetical protein
MVSGCAAVPSCASLHDVDFSEHYIRTTQHPQLGAGTSLRPNLRTTDSIDRAR